MMVILLALHEMKGYGGHRRPWRGWAWGSACSRLARIGGAGDTTP